jgi:hypothetical protein
MIRALIGEFCKAGLSGGEVLVKPPFSLLEMEF